MAGPGVGEGGSGTGQEPPGSDAEAAADKLLDADLTAPPAVPADGHTLPEAALRRFSSRTWSSGLSVADFASCVSMGMDPVGYVQGYAVMQWSWYRPYAQRLSGPPSPTGRHQYSEGWSCPHGFVSSEHRTYGFNYEQTWVEQGWTTGWQLARDRMLEEAIDLGAHGVIGVVDDMRPLVGTGTEEFRMLGTAVVVEGAERPAQPFSTFLSGQRLAKLIEAGFVPVGVVAALSSVQMIGYCMTQLALTGAGIGAWSGGSAGVQPIVQLNRAQRAVRTLAREHVRAQLGSDSLQGAVVEQFQHHAGEADLAIQCVMKGTRVRRFKAFDPVPEPAPVVRLG